MEIPSSPCILLDTIFLSKPAGCNGSVTFLLSYFCPTLPDMGMSQDSTYYVTENEGVISGMKHAVFQTGISNKKLPRPLQSHHLPVSPLRPTPNGRATFLSLSTSTTLF